MKSNDTDAHAPTEGEFDDLFDVYLRPLRNRHARRIFNVLVEEEEAGALTTFDIQAKLDERGIKLSKKEINGWLHALSAASLVVKGVERGKPTTRAYEGRYTFDLWRLTPLGAGIARGLPNIIGARPSLLEFDPYKSLAEISGMEEHRRTQALKRLNEMHLLAGILKKLLESSREMDKASLKKKLTPTDLELERLISMYSRQGRGADLISRAVRKPGLKTRILSLLGRSSYDGSTYTLTEKGRRLAKSLWS